MGLEGVCGKNVSASKETDRRWMRGGAPRRKGCVGNTRHVPVLYTTKQAIFAFLCAFMQALTMRDYYAAAGRPDSCIAELNKKDGGGGESCFPFTCVTRSTSYLADRRREREGRTYGPCTPANSSSLLLPSSSSTAETILPGSPLSTMLKQNAPT
ncbi:hypothetical protein COCVIDRAFT_18614 [Bipolaris victoriae FI3]|uniref:Uncharacterized protein n=1 Tax=Bipolaris victoriae (strain FI3) TaxID=930091 RepID=W7E722_BIPV3|nr:hypothetical protein COCVIDRAFT_18614 [Bipolaris victoriae FI3]